MEPDAQRAPLATAVALAERLRTRLAAGDAVTTALFVKLADVDAALAVAAAGVDVVIVDLEHSQLTPAHAQAMAGQLVIAGVPCLVRIAEVDRGLINRLLEAGATGIQLSTTTSASQVRDLVAAAHYPPRGRRSFSLAHREAGYGLAGREDYLSAARAGPLLVVQIETHDLVDPVEDVVGAGADLVFVGTEDLRLTSQAAGADPEQRIEAVARACTAAGVAWGCYAPPAEVPRRRQQGAAFVATGSDLGLLAQAARSHIASVRSPR